MDGRQLIDGLDWFGFGLVFEALVPVEDAREFT